MHKFLYKIKYLRKFFIKLVKIFYIFLKIFRSFKNFLIIILKNDINNIYIPNFLLKNVIKINPNKIKFHNSIPLKFNNSTKFILDFNWDKTNKLIQTSDHPTYITCNELFVQNKRFEETKNYFYLKDKIKDLKVYKNCRNDDDIINFLKKKVDLFKSIKLNGVKKNFISNVQFMIDKNYDLVKINSGNHRMIISRILSLKKIPIEIVVIHKECFKENKSNKIQIKQINDLIEKIEKKYN